jgi:hypothetical protein
MMTPLEFVLLELPTSAMHGGIYVTEQTQNRSTVDFQVPASADAPASAFDVNSDYAGNDYFVPQPKLPVGEAVPIAADVLKSTWFPACPI